MFAQSETGPTLGHHPTTAPGSHKDSGWTVPPHPHDPSASRETPGALARGGRKMSPEGDFRRSSSPQSIPYYKPT